MNTTRQPAGGSRDPSPWTPSEDADKADIKEAWNVLSDTVTGVNVRWSDNKFQAVFVSVSVLVLAPVGAVLAAFNPGWNLPWFAAAGLGAFAGLVFGIFASGIWLGIYRLTQHLRGKHD